MTECSAEVRAFGAFSSLLCSCLGTTDGVATTPIPTQDLFALRNELTMLSEHVEKLLRYSFVEDPKPEASPDPKAEPSAVPETRSKRRQV